jgi:hypothetical protein
MRTNVLAATAFAALLLTNACASHSRATNTASTIGDSSDQVIQVTDNGTTMHVVTTTVPLQANDAANPPMMSSSSDDTQATAASGNTMGSMNVTQTENTTAQRSRMRKD